MVQIYHWIGLIFCELCARKAKLFFQSKLSFQSLRAIPILKAVSSLQEERQWTTSIETASRDTSSAKRLQRKECGRAVQCAVHRPQVARMWKNSRLADLNIASVSYLVWPPDFIIIIIALFARRRLQNPNKNKYVRRVSDQVPDASDQSQTNLATGDRPGLKPSVIALANHSSSSCLILSNCGTPPHN